jgi:phosphatidylserine synthase
MESAQGPNCAKQFNHLPYLMGPIAAGLFTLPLSFIYSLSPNPDVRNTLIALSVFSLTASLFIHFWRLHENTKKAASASVTLLTVFAVVLLQILLFLAVSIPMWQLYNPHFPTRS